MKVQSRIELKKVLKELNATKEEIEKEIEEIKVSLDNQGVGLKGNLIDKEGFPRNDVDLFAVRTERQRFNILQTDHKNLMKEIEKTLKEYMSLPIAGHENQSKLISGMTKRKGKIDPSEVLFVVDDVTFESPAAVSGLEFGDEILKFGDFKVDKTKSSEHILGKLSGFLQENVNKAVEVKVNRSGKILHKIITPSKWDGDGLLGAYLVPNQA
eukprot:snap_masked-scaffold_32-processed-gene-2.4-mRNA-1 protein AED:0.68 eAED:0.68 QI:0/-1/0/1/-1/1/1/0/211